MKKKLLNCLSFCLLTSVSQAQTTLTFQPDATIGKDAVIQSASANTNSNYGTSDHIEAAAWTYSGSEGIVRSFFDFTQLSAIPVNSNIVSAKLSLYAMDAAAWQHSTLSGSNEAWIERITSSWDESTVTWNNQPTSTVTNRISLAQSTSATQNYLDIDVTQLVQDMIDQPSTSYGFLIKLQTESYYRRMGFCSSDHTNSALRPKLVVTYTSTLDVSESEKSAEVVCYPNPVSGVLTISTSGSLAGSAFQLTDQLGRVVKTGLLEAGNTILETTGLSTGTYILQTGSKKVTLAVN